MAERRAAEAHPPAQREPLSVLLAPLSSAGAVKLCSHALAVCPADAAQMCRSDPTPHARALPCWHLLMLHRFLGVASRDLHTKSTALHAFELAQEFACVCRCRSSQPCPSRAPRQRVQRRSSASAAASPATIILSSRQAASHWPSAVGTLELSSLQQLLMTLAH